MEIQKVNNARLDEKMIALDKFTQHISEVQPIIISVFVQNLNGTTLTLNLKNDSAIVDIKHILEEKLKVQDFDEGFRLNFGGKQLMAGTLSDYCIQKNSTIQLTQSIKGGLDFFGALLFVTAFICSISVHATLAYLQLA